MTKFGCILTESESHTAEANCMGIYTERERELIVETNCMTIYRKGKGIDVPSAYRSAYRGRGVNAPTCGGSTMGADDLMPYMPASPRENSQDVRIHKTREFTKMRELP